MLDAFGDSVSAVDCYVLCVVGLSLKLAKLEPATLNTLQQGGQTSDTSCIKQCFHLA